MHKKLFFVTKSNLQVYTPSVTVFMIIARTGAAI